MKSPKRYESPEMEIVLLENDIITSSLEEFPETGGNGEITDPGDWNSISHEPVLHLFKSNR